MSCRFCRIQQAVCTINAFPGATDFTTREIIFFVYEVSVLSGAHLGCNANSFSITCLFCYKCIFRREVTCAIKCSSELLGDYI